MQEDPAGQYKVSKLDPRMMVQRLPHERGNPTEKYYRLLPEGSFRDYDGFTQTSAPAYSLDANRMFPYQYAPQGVQAGAGSYPGYLPQADHVTKAISARNNICTMQSYHTSGRMVLWPNGLAEPAGDLPAYTALSALGVEAMHYKEVLGNYCTHSEFP